MKKLPGLILATFSVCACGAALIGSVTAQEMFPEGPGRDTLFYECTQCHSVDRMMRGKRTADDWAFIVYDMIGRGAPVYAEDINDLTQYLVDNFGLDE